MSVIELSTSNQARCDVPVERTALGRAQLIIDAFTPDTPVLSLVELARHAGLPKSTTHRFAEQMVALGWLERRLSGYRIGIKLYEMGELCERRNRLRQAAAPHLLRLAHVVGRSAYLTVLDHDSVLCLERFGAPHTRPTRAGRRIRFPVLTTVFGRSILAFEPPADIEYQISVAQGSGAAPCLRETVADDLAQIRKDGFALGFSTRSATRFLGVPLRNSGRAIASISIAGAGESLSPDLAGPVIQTVNAIWNDLFNVA